MNPARRREMVDREHPSLPIVGQCVLLGVSRSSIYYRPQGASEEDLSLMREIDRQYLETPFYGSRRMKAWLERQGIPVSRKRVQRLMRVMGLRAIYRRPRTSRPAQGVRVYPYLLGKAEITRPNQVWAADITYLPMERGFLYLVAVMDWHSRYVLSWRLSNTLEAGFCAEALVEALERGGPEVFNTDQGSQFTSQEFTQVLQDRGVKISMDGKGRYADNIFVERLWRTVGSVSVDGDTVVLTLVSAATSEDVVVVSYTPPSDAATARTRDLAGNAAAGFNSTEVFNDTDETAESEENGEPEETTEGETPLTVSLEATTESHNGTDAFIFEIRFSEEFPLSYKTLRDLAFTVSGGEVLKAQRLDKPSNIRWLITVEPDSNGDVTVVLPVTQNCAADGAICTGDGRKLSTRLELTVSGPGQ